MLCYMCHYNAFGSYVCTENFAILEQKKDPIDPIKNNNFFYYETNQYYNATSNENIMESTGANIEFKNVILRTKLTDDDKQCPILAEKGDCETNPTFMQEKCNLSCARKQNLSGKFTSTFSDVNHDCSTNPNITVDQCLNDSYIQKNCGYTCAKMINPDIISLIN